MCFENPTALSADNNNKTVMFKTYEMLPQKTFTKQWIDAILNTIKTL
jgi:hypothetical protein